MRVTPAVDLAVLIVSFLFVLVGVVALARRKWLLGGIALGGAYLLLFTFLALVGLLLVVRR